MLRPVAQEAPENRGIREGHGIGRRAWRQHEQNKLSVSAGQEGGDASGETAIAAGIPLVIVRLCPVGRVAAAVADGGGIEWRLAQIAVAERAAMAATDRYGE